MSNPRTFTFPVTRAQAGSYVATVLRDRSHWILLIPASVIPVVLTRLVRCPEAMVMVDDNTDTIPVVSGNGITALIALLSDPVYNPPRYGYAGLVPKCHTTHRALTGILKIPDTPPTSDIIGLFPDTQSTMDVPRVILEALDQADPETAAYLRGRIV